MSTNTGENRVRWIVIGAVAGAMIGCAFHEIAFCTAVGVAGGMAIGGWMDRHLPI